MGVTCFRLNVSPKRNEIILESGRNVFGSLFSDVRDSQTIDQSGAADRSALINGSKEIPN